MLIVGGGLYCEIFFQIFFSIFIFPNALINFCLKIIFLFMCILNFILDALSNPYLKKNSIQTIFQGVPHEWLSYSII